MVDVAALAAALALAGVHVAAAAVPTFGERRRRAAVSFGGGVSVSYIFVHLLPELGEAQETIEEFAHPAVSVLDRHAYLVALGGLLLFYGLERAVARSRTGDGDAENDESESEEVDAFRLHVASFACYNALVGALLVRRLESGRSELALFATAMALHLLVVDYGLSRHHRHRYGSAARWVLAGAVLAGWALATTVGVADRWVVPLSAFLAGAVVLNVFKEELPAESEGRMAPFVGGAVGYAALLLAV